MCAVLLQRHTISCLPRIKVTTKSPMVVKSELLRHLVLAWFSMSSKATKVQAEIRFYFAMLENHDRWSVPRGWWRVKGTKSHISCAPQLPSLAIQGSNMLNFMRRFSAGLLVPLQDATVTGGSTVSGPMVLFPLSSLLVFCSFLQRCILDYKEKR